MGPTGPVIVGVDRDVLVATGAVGALGAIGALGTVAPGGAVGPTGACEAGLVIDGTGVVAPV